MNHLKIYNSIIERAATRGLDKSTIPYYTECHHIVPRCLGGSDESSNLVLLSAREHYIAHVLLCHIHTNNHKLLYTVIMMNKPTSDLRKYSGSRLYRSLRENFSALQSVNMTNMLTSLVAAGDHPMQQSNEHSDTIITMLQDCTRKSYLTGTNPNQINDKTRIEFIINKPHGYIITGDDSVLLGNSNRKVHQLSNNINNLINRHNIPNVSIMHTGPGRWSINKTADFIPELCILDYSKAYNFT